MKNFLNKLKQFKSVKIFCVVTVTTFSCALLAILHAFNKNSQIQISENIDGIVKWHQVWEKVTGEFEKNS